MRKLIRYTLYGLLTFVLLWCLLLSCEALYYTVDVRYSPDHQYRLEGRKPWPLRRNISSPTQGSYRVYHNQTDRLLFIHRTKNYQLYDDSLWSQKANGITLLFVPAEFALDLLPDKNGKIIEL